MHQLAIYRPWRPYALAFLYLLLANGYDAYATDILMARGFEEANPFVLSMMKLGTSLYLGWKVALIGFSAFLLMTAALFAPRSGTRAFAAFVFWSVVAGFTVLCAAHAYFIHAFAAS